MVVIKYFFIRTGILLWNRTNPLNQGPRCVIDGIGTTATFLLGDGWNHRDNQKGGSDD